MREISGRTKLLCVVGSPVSHSLSPKIQNALAEQCGADFVYLAFDVTVDTLPDFIAAARTLRIAGFNVTMPLKEAILPYLDGADEIATVCGAVNTVSRDGDKLIGHNTDGEGLIASLKDDIPDFQGKTALIIGAGGAAKAISAALSMAGATVTALTRQDPKKITVPGAKTAKLSELPALAQTADLLINASPIGMAGNKNFESLSFLQALKKEAIVYDLVYNPEETALIKECKKQKIKVKPGLTLLEHQAIKAFEYFNKQ
jgi:shikimate dehydrogenase